MNLNLLFTAAEAAGLIFLQGANQPPSRNIGGFVAQVTVEERHFDELTITEHPVETGAFVADHAFKRPAEVIIRAGWSNSPSPKSTGLASLPHDLVAGLAQTLDGFSPGPDLVRENYEKLLVLQASRQLISIVTAKRSYQNMLIRGLAVTTDYRTENALIVTATCREIILVQTRTVAIPPASVHASPEKTGPISNLGTKQLQPAPNFNAAGPF